MLGGIRKIFQAKAHRMLAYVCVLGKLSFFCNAQAAEQPETGYIVRAWNTKDGLPQNTVNAMLRSRDGYLWLGTQNGLASFDGVRFRVFGTPDGLPSAVINVLLEDSLGALWVGTDNGVACWQAGRFMTLSRRDGLPDDYVNALVEDAAGSVWIGTRRGLSRWQHGKLMLCGPREGLPAGGIIALYRNHQGQLLASVDDAGLFIFEGGGFTRVQMDKARETNAAPQCMFEDSQNRLWLSFGNAFILCREQTGWKQYTTSDGVPWARIICLAETSTGLVCAGTFYQGIFYFKDGKFWPLDDQAGNLPDHTINSILPDKDGSLWLGTRIAGLVHQVPKQLITFSAAHGLSSNGSNLLEYVRSITWSADDKLYAVVAGGGVVEAADKPGVTPFYTAFPVQEFGGFLASAVAVLAAQDGSSWAGGANFICRQASTGNSFFYRIRDAGWLDHNAILSLCDGADHDVWVGTQKGRLFVYRGGQFFEPAGFTNSAPIIALAVGTDGSIWAGTTGAGLWHILFQRDAQCVASQSFPNRRISALRFDHTGALWVGSLGDGLSCLKHGTIFNLNLKDGLPDSTVSQILEDNDGNLWLGSNRGIFRIQRRELEEFAARKTEMLHPRTFGEYEGMLNEECSHGASPNCFKSPGGLLYFSTVRGVVGIDPKKFNRAEDPLSVLIEEVLLNGKTVWGGMPEDYISSGVAKPAPANNRVKTLVIPPGRRNLEFHYTAISSSAPERNQFRYQLVGLDPEWTEAGTRRMVNYSYLAPGEYHFRVSACGEDGLWNPAGTDLKLILQPHYYETGWFQAVVLGMTAASLVLIARGISHRRLRLRLERIQMLNAIETERSRIARDIHDDLGASLTQITLESELGQSAALRTGEAGIHYEKITSKSRQAVQALDEIVWAVNPRNDNLPRLVRYICRYADECFDSTGVRCWQKVSDELPQLPVQADHRHHFFLAIKEALHNVLKHSKASGIWLTITMDGRTLSVEVKDDGCGFDVANSDFTRSGLKNMKTRLAEIGGTMEISSTPQSGTSVRFTMPIKGKPGIKHVE